MKPSLKQSQSTFSSSPFLHFSREEWAQYSFDCKLNLSEADISRLRGFNERLSLTEVKMVYLPLCRLLNTHVAAAQQLHLATCEFFSDQSAKVPYIIGVSGSVAVGKSTTSRLLQALLSRWPNHPRVDLITTDGFLYTNAELVSKNLLHRKGFPESYNLRHMVNVLSALKSGCKKVSVPLYSHERYDIIPNGRQLIGNPDIVIIEGLNLLNTTAVGENTKNNLYISDFLDFSIFVHANTATIKQWYLQRFMAFRQQALHHPERYFHRFSQMPDYEAHQYAENIWNTINQANLLENILPFKNRAKLILNKNKDHSIASVDLRKP